MLLPSASARPRGRLNYSHKKSNKVSESSLTAHTTTTQGKINDKKKSTHRRLKTVLLLVELKFPPRDNPLIRNSALDFLLGLVPVAAAELVVRVHDFVLVRAVPGRALVGDELGFFLAGFDDLAAARVGGCEGGEEGGEEEHQD